MCKEIRFKDSMLSKKIQDFKELGFNPVEIATTIGFRNS
jgi:hypothetical protein